MAPDRRPNSALLFARHFVRHPFMLGAPLASSRFVVERVLKPVDWAKAKVVVEYGPGVGTLTSAILDRLAPDATLVAIETNPDFVRHMREALPDPRLHAVHGSAADVERILADLKLGEADAVVTGIPFSSLPTEVRDGVLASTRRVLRADGTLVVYQVRSAVLPHLERHFDVLQRSLEPRNILPMRVFVARPRPAL